jgi:hypothetical protein
MKTYVILVMEDDGNISERRITSWSKLIARILIKLNKSVVSILDIKEENKESNYPNSKLN